VLVPARLRDGASWSDACILNISSRGMMIHTGRPIRRGCEVELRRGEHMIVARVMWRDGARAGLAMRAHILGSWERRRPVAADARGTSAAD